MLNLEKLEEKAKEYLLTISDEDGEDWYDSYRGFATWELGAFLDWLKENNNDVDSV